MSTIRFSLVCLLFVLFYHFPVTVAAIWLFIPILSSLLNAYKPTPVNAYEEIKSAFDDIFEDVQHLPTVQTIPALSYRELQLALKNKYTATQRKKLGIKLNANKAQLQAWLDS